MIKMIATLDHNKPYFFKQWVTFVLWYLTYNPRMKIKPVMDLRSKGKYTIYPQIEKSSYFICCVGMETTINSLYKIFLSDS